jgi:4-alpha-glucanotransferase
VARQSGILLHVISLPSRFGIGDMGPEAFAFADFLAAAGQRIWQILPLNEPRAGHASPYHSISAFAGNRFLVSPERLCEDGLLGGSALDAAPSFPRGRIEYAAARAFRKPLLLEAHRRFLSAGRDEGHEAFCREHRGWLEDFALFRALKGRFPGRAWNEWPPELRDREPGALAGAREELSGEIAEEKFIQYLFFRQWEELRGYCRGKGIGILGDMAIYVDFDSADVWSHQEIFKLGKDRRPSFVSGVPPDYFSATGQLWGHPVYDWDAVRDQGFRWWIERIRHNLNLYDFLRVDHFRGLLAYWEVKEGEKTALGGRWVKAPSEEFFPLLAGTFPEMPFLAEDLGVITPDVTDAMERFGFPGMRVFLFAFGEDDPTHPYLPHNYMPGCVAYTGTHDTNTVRGWFEDDASPGEKERLFRYLGREVAPETVSWECVRAVSASVAERVIFPAQDLLGLGGEARVNRPGTEKDIYLWRLRPGQVDERLRASLRELTGTYGRLPEGREE